MRLSRSVCRLAILQRRGNNAMTTHLDILQLRLSNERIRLANAKTDGERELRDAWVKQLEKEVEGEKDFLTENDAPQHIEDEALLASLGL